MPALAVAAEDGSVPSLRLTWPRPGMTTTLASGDTDPEQGRLRPAPTDEVRGALRSDTDGQQPE